LENQWKIINWNVISSRVGLIQESRNNNSFIKELAEARLIRTRDDLRYSYKEVCEHMYLIVMTLEFLSRLKKGRDVAKKYAKSTASYINYTEFRTSATDLYNFIYFIQETPDNVRRLFQSDDAKQQRERTQLPQMELNRWLIKLADHDSSDFYFLMRLEQALNISSSDLKEIRRVLSFRNPVDSDIKHLSYRILNSFRSRMPLWDLKQELETILSGEKLDIIK
jgi:hypothetical protein